MIITLETAQARLDALAKPRGSLGRLESLAARLAVIQQSLSPVTRPRRIVLFAGDHGVAASGVTAWPSAVTGAMIGLICARRSSSSALARAQEADLRLVDVGCLTVAKDPPYFFRDARIAPGTADLSREAAMTVEQFEAAWSVGKEEASLAHAEGFAVLLAGEMGIGNTTPAACLTMLLAGIDASAATGRGAGADDVTLSRKSALVERAVERARALPLQTGIAALCGFEIAAMAGFFVQAARQGSTILLDGYVATAAALVAERLFPGSKSKMIAAHLSAEPGHRAALTALGLPPLLEWDLRLGEGTGALLALPMLDSAAALLRDVALLSDVAP
ncbi:nicotinate-nucleotide--dimethylbenzimidazole phosphoribosyltransferase [Rhizorhapis sp.]|uniref:nicotinate-nucleotide--dimethylbenzimidazole phosphoribosyltransferase n=1 Tax=Rhizorhapis sp. TaxID=1968842 RepID=UPI002B4877DA|nr:nicotinate-nucleotide--dimethylbenzimidazole phosphoribosyltransferase [Rhizorhapis sp.]HKR17191.1 nicotinate-nucleotide--dimethylbenzimidazole phosphoribosyltransferase [Rhizorhapis sp.]